MPTKEQLEQALANEIGRGVQLTIELRQLQEKYDNDKNASRVREVEAKLLEVEDDLKDEKITTEELESKLADIENGLTGLCPDGDCPLCKALGGWYVAGHHHDCPMAAI